VSVGCHSVAETPLPQGWTALRWSARKLAEMEPRLPVHTQWSEQGYFMFVDQGAEVEGLLEDSAHGSDFGYSTARVPLEVFVQNMSRAGYHRLTGLMSANGSMRNFLPGVRPFSSLTIPRDDNSCVGDDFDGQGHNAADLAVLSFWLASAGTTTHTHYDVDHNFFVQLSGTKTFTLFSPNDSSRLYFFPEAHPRARKSQVPLRQPSSHTDEPDQFDNLFPRFAEAERWVVTLEAGDVLFVRDPICPA
jgi:hypothetical protein